MRMADRLVLMGVVLMSLSLPVAAQTTAFSYQGSLSNNGVPASGNFDFELKLFDTASAGAQIGTTAERLNVLVTNGVFTISLDFGAGSLPGADRFLDISVRNAGSGAFVSLNPRQPITSSPYSVRSLNSETATTSANTTQLGGIAANQYVVTTDARLTDARPPTAGSGDYIQNRISPQPSSNFNISGNGTVGGTLSSNIVNTTTQYNIASNRVLSNQGTDNLFAGVGAGVTNSTGVGNAFFGRDSGLSNSVGFDNAFFGANAGRANTTGHGNAFFGTFAGQANLNGEANAFFGKSAGAANTFGGANTFIGAFAGSSNTGGNDNSFVGHSAGLFNTTGGDNAFFGQSAGLSNTTGSDNSFVGASAGRANTTGFSNAFFGDAAGRFNTTGAVNAFYGASAGSGNTTGANNAFFGASAGNLNTIGENNSFFGQSAGFANVSGDNNTIIGWRADVTSGNLNFATAIGSNAIVTASNRIQLGRSGSDTVSVGLLDAATATQLCINGTVLASCSSSQRYKENIMPFRSGLSLVKRLRPVSFDWAGRGERDLGLIAEEVDRVEPLLVTRNEKGEIQGVKYDQLTVTLINVVNEQQEQIEKQQEELTKQTVLNRNLALELEALKAIVCSIKPDAASCGPRY